MSRPIDPDHRVDEPVDRVPEHADADRITRRPGNGSFGVDPDPAGPPAFRPADDGAGDVPATTSVGPRAPDTTDTTDAGPPVPPGGPVGHRDVLVRQRERFGGVKIGSAFFGWLAATGLAAILVTLLVAVGIATGTTVDQPGQPATDQAWVVGLVGAVLLLVIVFVAYLAGGYVAGRMARFNGIRQGIAVWVWGVVIAAILAAVAAIAGSRFDLLTQLNLPRIRLGDQLGDQTSIAQTLIEVAIVAAVALVAAILGGLAGMRFHRRVDRVDTAPVPDTRLRSG